MIFHCSIFLRVSICYYNCHKYKVDLRLTCTHPTSLLMFFFLNIYLTQGVLREYDNFKYTSSMYILDDCISPER